VTSASGYSVPLMRSRRQHGIEELLRLRDAGLGMEEFRDAALRCLRSFITIDAAFFATVDAETMVMTSAWTEAPLAAAARLFLDNEYDGRDVNKFTDLADAIDPVSSLDQATSHAREESARYRDLMAPMGLGDEARAVLRSHGQCWGVICVHREDGEGGFSIDDLEVFRQVAPILGEGLRRGLAITSLRRDGAPGPGPGVLILDTQLQLVSSNAQAERWLRELQTIESRPSELPIAVLSAAAAAVDVGNHEPPPRTRVRRTDGGFMTVHASALRGTKEIVVVLDDAAPDEVTSLLLAAHGLTPAQHRVAALVLRGRSTQQIANELRISTYTVQEHLSAVFGKFGIGSRRELVAAVGSSRH